MTKVLHDVLNKNTLMPLSVVVGMIVATATLVIYGETMRNQVSGISDDLTTIKKILNQSAKDDWTLADQKVWSANLKANNPSLIMPEVEKTSTGLSLPTD